MTKKKRRTPQRIERLKLCTSHTGGDINNIAEAQLISSLRQAMAESKSVRVTYDSVFNRCITTVTRL